MAPTIPYYEFREVLSVRDADATRFRTLADLRGRRVGTLGGTIAYEILLRAEREYGIQRGLVRRRRAPVQRSGARPRRRRAARQRARRAPRPRACRDSPSSRRASRSATTSACWRRETRRCATRSTRSCAARCATARSSGSSASGTSGTTISRRSTRRLLAGEPIAAGQRLRRTAIGDAALRAGRPRGATCRRCLRAAVVTLVLSCLAMALAVVLGVLIASGRVYGSALARTLLTGYVELMRGTPILLQLFVLYYGLAAAIRLPAFVAALARPGAELRRVRKRDLPRRARGRAARPARSRRERSG